MFASEHMITRPASLKPIEDSVSAFFLASQVSSPIHTDGKEIGGGISIDAHPISGSKRNIRKDITFYYKMVSS
tara:strand:- start:1666 stop:1884 length:219 start_codon:yes stop_codon:yes gene_type:complete